MEVAGLVLPVFTVIVTGWLAGWLGYISRSLADGLVHFAYNVAMPALLIVTIAQESAGNLLEWRFLLAFGGGSSLCFALVFLAFAPDGARPRQQHDVWNDGGHDQYRIRRPADPALHLWPARRSARRCRHHIRSGRDVPGDCCPPRNRTEVARAGRQLVASSCEADRAQSDGAINPDRFGVGDCGLPMPTPVAAYLNIFAAALTPCALFAIGLGLSVEGIRSNFRASVVLATVKLVIMPLVVYGLCVASGLNPL